jgi:succinate dehydrogenase / fumarate reductase, cytochrome b subunit
LAKQKKLNITGMNWYAQAMTSSIGKKLVMALAGIFLILFLPVHMGINLLILGPDTVLFNIAANFMASNLVIKIVEIILFLAIILHVIYGLILQVQNWFARPKRYRIENYTSQSSFFSKWMIHTAAIILTFLIIHFFDFYFKVKIFGEEVDDIIINGKHYHDLGALVLAKFEMPLFVIIYLIGFLFLGFHLLHAFQSAFQTLGLNHSKYTPVIKALGVIYTVLIFAGFSLIPLLIYFA